MTASSVFDVTATRADGWWEVDVAGLRGGWTQARRIDQVMPMIIDLIATLREIDPADVRVDIQYRSGER